MKTYTILILYILFIEIFSHNNTKDHTNHSSELKTFIVKTKLTKEELEELLAKSETAFLYLRSKENKTHEIKEENKNDMNNIVEEKTDSLEKQIEEEIEREALNPPEEFYVKEMNEDGTSEKIKHLLSEYRNKLIFFKSIQMEEEAQNVYNNMLQKLNMQSVEITDSIM